MAKLFIRKTVGNGVMANFEYLLPDGSWGQWKADVKDTIARFKTEADALNFASQFGLQPIRWQGNTSHLQDGAIVVLRLSV